MTMGKCDMVGFGKDCGLSDTIRSLYGHVGLMKSGIIPFDEAEAIRREQDQTDEAVEVVLWTSGTIARLFRETAERQGTTPQAVLSEFVKTYEGVL